MAFGLEGKQSTWEGYTRTDFEVDGRPCYVVAPREAAPGTPWLWRARFPQYHAEVDKMLLADGFHIAFVNTDGMFGSPRALRHWEAFYRVLTEQEGFHAKPVLYGVSRGGLFVYRWAKNHPDAVACIYCDTPVCDPKSWPGGRGSGKGDEPSWQAFLKEYGFDQSAAIDYGDNPIDNLGPVAMAQIPIMHIVTEDDQHVPPVENTYVLQEKLQDLGHRVFYVISLPHGNALDGHHFDLTHPEIPYRFIKKYTMPDNVPPIYVRDGLQNCRHIFQTTRRGRVAFLGGSITEMNGWHNLVMQSLKQEFPNTEFEFIEAGIASTDSTMGAFRLQQDVLSHGPVDLLFIESAVNELHNGRHRDEILRGVEGIIVHARRQNPNIDIIAQYFYDDHYESEYRARRTPWQIATLEEIAIRYGINAIDQAKEITRLFESGQMSPDDFGGVHPAPAGHQVYADLIDQLMKQAWSVAPASSLAPHGDSWPIASGAYDFGELLDPSLTNRTRTWQLTPAWKPPLGGATRTRFVNVPFVSATEPEAELSLTFDGTAIGMIIVAGPDAGIVEYRIDDGPLQQLDQFTKWSAGLNIPWIYILAHDLPPTSHTLTLKTSQDRNAASKGHACHVRYFVVDAK